MAAEDYIDMEVLAAHHGHSLLSPTPESLGYETVDWDAHDQRYAERNTMAVVKKVTPSDDGEKKKTLKKKAIEKSIIDLWAPLIVPATSIQDYLMLLFGEKKIGKSTLASLFPDALFMFSEPNKALAVRAVRVNNVPLITTWEDARRATKALKKESRGRTIVVDTIDVFFKMCWDAMLAEMGIEHPSDETWGKGWAKIRDEFDRWMRDLIATGKGIILISHDIEREVKTRSGESYHKLVPSVPNQARESVEGVVDIWAYFGYDDNRRVLQIRGNDHVAAGHRLQNNFRTPNGEEVTVIDMTNVPETGYKNFTDAFNNRYVPTIKLRSEEETERPKAAIKKKVVKKKTA